MAFLDALTSPGLPHVLALVLGGIIWYIRRVEGKQDAHEDKCSERYKLIFGMLRDLSEKLAALQADVSYLKGKSDAKETST